MTQQEPIISSLTRVHKKFGISLILTTSVAMIIGAFALFAYAPHEQTVGHIPYILALTVGIGVLMNLGLEVVGFMPTRIDVFSTFIRIAVSGRDTDVKLADIVSITQREGVFRDEIVIRTTDHTYWLGNLVQSFKVYDAIQDAAINSNDERIRNARFMVKRDAGGLTWSETIGGNPDGELPLLTARSSFFRFALSGPLLIYVGSFASFLVTIWGLATKTSWPFIFNWSTIIIMLAFLGLLVICAAYTFFIEEAISIFPDRAVITSALSQITVYKEDMARCSVRRWFIAPFIRIQLKDGKLINLRGFRHSKAIVDAINWSVSTRQVRSDALKAEAMTAAAKSTNAGFSLRKTGR